MAEQVRLKIKRQAGPNSKPYWEEFVVPCEKDMNVISALIQIQMHPVNAQGEKTTPVVFDCCCLEEVCGACSMLINGQPRQACSALIGQLKQPVFLEPLSKFPLICDLMVDRNVLFEYLKKVKAWIDIDGTYDMGPGPKVSEEIRLRTYELSKCMSCGLCMEACPQFNDRSPFMGPAVMGQVRLFTLHPTGEMHMGERLDAITGEGGIAGCSNSQNCIKVCPKRLPLTEVIAELNRITTVYSILKWARAK